LELDQVPIYTPLGKGDAKALIKSQVILRWQDEWELENNARYYHRKMPDIIIGTRKIITSLGLNMKKV